MQTLACTEDWAEALTLSYSRFAATPTTELSRLARKQSTLAVNATFARGEPLSSSSDSGSVQRKQLGELDALRGLAILGVILVHSVFAWEVRIAVSPTLFQFIFMGQRGVQLFYIVSAFTLALSAGRRQSEHGAIRNFFVRRFFRIAPMFYIAILIAWLLHFPAAGGRTARLMAFTFTSGLSPTNINAGALGGWSVADEALFYLALPFLLRKIRSSRTAAIALTAVCVVARLAFQLSLSKPPVLSEYWGFSSIVAEAPVFLLGLLTYFVWKELRVAPERRRTLSLILVLLGGILFLSLPIGNQTIVPASLALCMMVYALMLHPWPLLVNRATIFLGKISFSIYLLHFFLLLPVHRRLDHLQGHLRPSVCVAFVFATVLALAVPVATLTWNLIEKPGMWLGAWVIQWMSSRWTPAQPIPALTDTKDVPEAQF